MSKGLGAVERFVLEAAHSAMGSIVTKMSHERWLAENGLTCTFRHDCCDIGPYAVGIPWRSEYESVRRAVRSLERKGLVRTHWQADDQEGSRPATYLWVSRTEEGNATAHQIRMQRLADSQRTTGETNP